MSTPESIVAVVADVTGVPVKHVARALDSRGPNARARQVAVWLVRRHLGMTLEGIAELFGFTTRQSVRYCLDRVKADRSLACIARECESRLAGVKVVA